MWSLTPPSDIGSKDRAIGVLDAFKRQSSLKDYAIWDYDQIRMFLDGAEDVRTAYAGYITPGDVLEALIARFAPRPADLYRTFVMFLERELLTDASVNLEQAGHTVDEHIPLASVFVDLPIQNDEAILSAKLSGSYRTDRELVDVGHLGFSSHEESGFIKDILTAATERLDPLSLGTSLVPGNPDATLGQPRRGRFVLIGGPGQGKTTLTQFLCQIFRTSIIASKSTHTLSPEVQTAVGTIQQHCDLEGINHRVVPRFPFKLLLNDFASALSTSSSSVTSVVGYLARQITRRTDSAISSDDLRRFLAEYPSIIIFDGLDEVPASSNRNQVMDAIREFWIDATNANADVLSIATSRPQGYNEDFSPVYYQHCQLAELSPQLGWHVAQRLAEVRYRSDEDRKQKVLNRLERAFSDDSTARLMRSPLQVTIMTALVDRVGQPPQARWNLFNQYYEVIYDREVERSIPASTILRDYQPDIKAIHNQVGLILQIESESTGSTDAKLSRERFVSLVEARLETEGHPSDSLRPLARQIVEAASHRLVFLVEVEAEQVGFEIRSLQEFMAAECLMDGTDQHIRTRLDEIAPIPFWRNVFLFAAGKCFSQRQELREMVCTICAELNEEANDSIAGMYLAGSDLAISLLDEGSSRHQPKFESLLARIAIRALDTANQNLQLRLADRYEPHLQVLYQNEIQPRLTSNSVVHFLGAWHCLFRLAATDNPWATGTAMANWPQDIDRQLTILREVGELNKNPWVLDKLVELIPATSPGILRTILRSEVYRRGLEAHSANPVIEAAMTITRAGLSRFDTAKILDTGLSYGPIRRLTTNDSVKAERLQDTEGWHSSWDIYKYAGDFLEAPSKDSLANVLTAVASSFYVQENVLARSERENLPWPVMACLGSCSTGQELLELADRVNRGELGDVEDWKGAEVRWFDKGITREDLISMSEQRLPFDADIRSRGFPTSIPTLGPIFVTGRYPSNLEEMLDIYSNLAPGQTRSFVAATINWLLVYYSLPRDTTFPLPHIDFPMLESVYQDLPARSLIPIHILVNLIGDSTQQITDLLKMVKTKDFIVHSDGESSLMERSIDLLRMAYMGMDEDALLLPILAEVAESGHLVNHHLIIKHPRQLETAEEKLAALIITLSQETWQTDSSEQLIQDADDIGGSSINVFNRVVGTLESTRPSGANVEKFVAGLTKWIPADDFDAHERYVNLLEDVLRRRTSHFADPNETSRFALPHGIVPIAGEIGAWNSVDQTYPRGLLLVRRRS